MKTFEIVAPFWHSMLTFAGFGSLGLCGLVAFQAMSTPGTTFVAWLLYYLPFFMAWLCLLPAIHAFKRQPRVWIEGGRLFTRAAPIRPIQSLPLSEVVAERLRKPRLSDYLFTGLKLESPSGGHATIAVAMFTRAQLTLLADAISSKAHEPTL